jgi:hypothetical protein
LQHNCSRGTELRASLPTPSASFAHDNSLTYQRTSSKDPICRMKATSNATPVRSPHHGQNLKPGEIRLLTIHWTTSDDFELRLECHELMSWSSTRYRMSGVLHRQLYLTDATLRRYTLRRLLSRCRATSISSNYAYTTLFGSTPSVSTRTMRMRRRCRFR